MKINFALSYEAILHFMKIKFIGYFWNFFDDPF